MEVGEGGWRDPTDNLNINKYQKWQPFITNYGMPSAKSGSARRVSYEPAFIISCLNTSHTCLPSHMFANFAFLIFSVFPF